MSKTKEKDVVNYIITGSRYQVVNDKGETIPEFGVGVFRNGVKLSLASDLYGRMVTARTTELTYPDKASARTLAANAFSLAEAFLEEMDKHFRMPLAPGNNNSDRK
jgi:hypothetical protein